VRERLWTENQEITTAWALGLWSPRAWWQKAQIKTVLETTPNAHRLPGFYCHFYCAYLGTPWNQIVGAFCVVSNIESQYPPFHGRAPLSIQFRCKISDTKLTLIRFKNQRQKQTWNTLRPTWWGLLMSDEVTINIRSRWFAFWSCWGVVDSD